MPAARPCCCDLLSFYYLCRTGNNRGVCVFQWARVVICFHFTIFVVLETTFPLIHHAGDTLWFAFILLSLSYWKQPIEQYTDGGVRCDLLSFYYLCRTGNNKRVQVHRHGGVVICFHFTIFVVLETTFKSFAVCYRMLWFAFILLSLSYWKQHDVRSIRAMMGCDLLSFYYLCRTGNNPATRSQEAGRSCDLLSFYYLCRTGNNITTIRSGGNAVVICFHFTIFVVLETTRSPGSKVVLPLWFAFILLSLSYWKQHLVLLFVPAYGCDLLSFYYLCRTGNNPFKNCSYSMLVVICFHFTIFVVLETTS